MDTSRLQAAVPSGEGLRYSTETRSGNAVGLTDERFLMVDGEATSVEYDTIEEVTVQDADWYLGVMSLLLVGFGVFSFERNVFAGLGFVAAGLVSIYLVYRKRGKVELNVVNRPKPLSFYLDDPETFLSRLEARLDDYEDRLIEGHDATAQDGGDAASEERTATE